MNDTLFLASVCTAAGFITGALTVALYSGTFKPKRRSTFLAPGSETPSSDYLKPGEYLVDPKKYTPRMQQLTKAVNDSQYSKEHAETVRKAHQHFTDIEEAIDQSKGRIQRGGVIGHIQHGGIVDRDMAKHAALAASYGARPERIASMLNSKITARFSNVSPETVAIITGSRGPDPVEDERTSADDLIEQAERLKETVTARTESAPPIVRTADAPIFEVNEGMDAIRKRLNETQEPAVTVDQLIKMTPEDSLELSKGYHRQLPPVVSDVPPEGRVVTRTLSPVELRVQRQLYVRDRLKGALTPQRDFEKVKPAPGPHSGNQPRHAAAKGTSGSYPLHGQVRDREKLRARGNRKGKHIA